MKELWINNQLVDLSPKVNIALTRQCNKLNDPSNRQADYSNQFKIPPTANNKRICGMPHVVASDSINPYTKLPATYIENGSELVSNGVAIIEEFNGDINVTIYSGIYDFFNTIGDKDIRELDLSEADHVFNLANVQAGNTSDKYVYPLIQWGATDKDNDIVDIRYQRPALKASFVIDKIFESAGYQKGGDVFNSQSYSNLVIPIVEDSLIDTEAVLLANSFKAHTENIYVMAQGSNIINRINLSYFGSGDSYNSTEGLYQNIVRNNSVGAYAPSLGYRYVATKQVNVNVNFGMYARVTTARTFFWIVKNGQFNPNSENFFRYAFEPGIGGIYYIEFSLENIRLEPGEYIEFLSEASLIEIYPTGELLGNPLDYSYISVTALNTTEIGQNIYMSRLVPAVKQKDLLKDLMIAYCLVPQYDPLTRTINFVQFDAIGENKAKATTVFLPSIGSIDPRAIEGYKKQIKILVDKYSVDWSNKLDIKSGYSVKYRFSEYAQTNYIKWAQDDDRAEEGTGIIFIDDNTLELKKDLFTTTLAASIQEVNFKGNVGVNIKRYTRVEADQYNALTDYSEGDLALYNGIVYEALSDFSNILPTNVSYWTPLEIQYENTESVAPRLLLIRDYDNAGSPPSSSLTYTDGTNNLTITNAKIAYFVDPSQSYDLGFQFLIEQNYQTLTSVLNKTKIVVANFKLSDNDFKNIDFFKPIYIGYFGNYFYLNQPTNYISGRLTACELVRL
jgi:hypothetical protein